MVPRTEHINDLEVELNSFMTVEMLLTEHSNNAVDAECLVTQTHLTLDFNHFTPTTALQRLSQ